MGSVNTKAVFVLPHSQELTESTKADIPARLPGKAVLLPFPSSCISHRQGSPLPWLGVSAELRGGAVPVLLTCVPSSEACTLLPTSKQLCITADFWLSGSYKGLCQAVYSLSKALICFQSVTFFLAADIRPHSQIMNLSFIWI